MNSRLSHLLPAVGRGVLVLALFWLTSFALVQFGQRVFGGWAASQLGIVLACVLGVYFAVRMRVRPVAYLLAGQLAFGVAELALHSVYGIRAVQGAPTHLAVMVAGTLGVLLGWYLSKRPLPQSPQRASTPSALPLETSKAHPQPIESHAA